MVAGEWGQRGDGGGERERSMVAGEWGKHGDGGEISNPYALVSNPYALAERNTKITNTNNPLEFSDKCRMEENGCPYSSMGEGAKDEYGHKQHQLIASIGLLPIAALRREIWGGSYGDGNEVLKDRA
ncbi:hypothetical protein LguiB_001154 [Lonicera macranthoides]